MNKINILNCEIVLDDWPFHFKNAKLAWCFKFGSEREMADKILKFN
jgi:hypothetical protein